jgi:hypothetical protein
MSYQANKSSSSFSWTLPPIIEWWDTVTGLPVAPEVGDRYGSDGTAFGWTDGYIYEWDGHSWVETEPEEGYEIWDLFELILWVFFSGGWMEVGSDSFVMLDQTIPQTFTAGDVAGSGLLKVTDGTLGLATPLAGTKVYYVSDSSGGAVNRKLTFTDGILTSES